MDFEFNYDELIVLDAESLAEDGIGKAYEALLPKLRQYVSNPAKIEEVVDYSVPRYSVKCRDQEFHVYGHDNDAGPQSWGTATYVFFTIVNNQLAESEYRFYANNGGNDLGGFFLTPAQAESARKSLQQKTDWPYLPSNDSPWYGQFH